MKVAMLPLFTLFIFFGISDINKKPKNKNQLHDFPGCVYLDEHFSFDRTEITCFNWLEYLFWQNRVFGQNSKEYISSLPDTNVWVKVDSTAIIKDYGMYYLRHPAYRDFPVVGISQEQAWAFSKWRSDRVFEWYLIDMGLLVYDSFQNPDTYFTIEKYYAGQIPNTVGHEKSEYYPEYRLPSIKEREKMLEYNQKLNQLKLKNRRCLSKYIEIWSDIEVCLRDDCPKDYTRDTYPSCKWIYVHNLRGNVAEWLNEPNLAAGGSWNDKLEDILKQDLREYDGPNAYTGFRNVGVWRKWGD